MNFVSSTFKQCHYRYASFILLALMMLSESPVQAQIWKRAISLIDNSKRTASPDILPIDISVLQASMQVDYKALISPKLGGRLMGTKGAEMAGMYVGTTMNSFGVAPYARNFVHTFSYVSGKEYTPETRLTIGSDYLFIPEDAFPAPYSSIGEVQSYVLPNTTEFGQPWIIPLYENAMQANNPKFDWITASYKRALLAQKKGAAAVLFFDNIGSNNAPHNGEKTELPELKIPVLIVSHNAYIKKISDIQTLTPFYLNLKLRNVYAKAANIIGYIDNHAKMDVVICSHYDGALNADLEAGATADNDVSGVTVMMSVARLLTKSNAKNYNYILVAFSGENKGQLGSKALFDDKSFESHKLAYVINLDQLGNLHRAGSLYVAGANSAQTWVPFFKKVAAGVHYKFEEKEAVSSDNLTFLAHHIPTVSFSTSAGSQSDDWENQRLMNFVGADSVVSLLYRFIVTMDGLPRPVFAVGDQQDIILHELQQRNQHEQAIVSPKTEMTTRKKAVAEKVIPVSPIPVGIILDSTYNGYGVRILKVLDKQAAEIAGLETGDIIMEMDGKKINNLSDYKQEIESLKANDNVEVKVKRGATVQEFPLQNL